MQTVARCYAETRVLDCALVVSRVMLYLLIYTRDFVIFPGTKTLDSFGRDCIDIISMSRRRGARKDFAKDACTISRFLDSDSLSTCGIGQCTFIEIFAPWRQNRDRSAEAEFTPPSICALGAQDPGRIGYLVAYKLRVEDRTDLSCFAATAFLYVFIIRVRVIWNYPYRAGFSEAMCSDPLGEVRGRAEREQPLARCLGPVGDLRQCPRIFNLDRYATQIFPRVQF